MLLIIRIFIIISIIISTYAYRRYTILGIMNTADIFLRDLWTEGDEVIDNKNYTVNQTLIKIWDKLTPYGIRFLFKDVNKHILGRIFFNASSTNSSLSSWFSGQSFLRSLPNDIVHTDGLTTHTRGDNISLVPSNGNSSGVYVFFGKINVNSSTRSKNYALMSKDGHPHEITADVLESIENNKSKVIISGYMTVSNETFQKLKFPNDNRYFVNGLEIRTDTSSWNFSLYYNVYSGCDRSVNKYKQYQDVHVSGENISIKFDVIGVSCIKLVLSNNVYNFNYTIYEIESPLATIDELRILAFYHDEEEQQYLESLTVNQTSNFTTDVTSIMTQQSTNTDVTISTSQSTSVTDVTDETSSASPSITESRTTSILYTTTVKSGCECCKNTNNYTKPTDSELEEIVKNIQRELIVNKSELSKTIRKKTSAPDDRPTAAASGYISGILLFCVIFFIVFSDLPLLIKPAKKCFKKYKTTFPP